MRYLLSVILTALLLGLSTPADGQTRRGTRSSAKPARKEIVSVAEAPPKTADNTLGVTVEKYVSNYEINADGTGRESHEIRKRCRTEICVQRFGSVVQVYNVDLQKIKVLDAYLVKADGKEVKIPTTSIVDRPTAQSEAAPGFSSLRELEVKFTDLKPGDAYHLKFELLTTRPTFDRRFDSLEFYPRLFDWNSIEVNVTAPVDYPVFIEAVGLDGGKLPDDNGRAKWNYRKQNVARLELEPAMLNIQDESPRFAITSFRDANELGSVFWENVNRKSVVTPELQVLADDITKGLATTAQQTSAIYDWVNKNIRYLLVVLDRGGWVPHNASDIVKNGYGDCKDYTTLIHTLLKAKGIESIPVLIRSDYGDWFPSVATADYFNHAILYIPSLDLYADATMANTRLGIIPQTIVGKKALLAGPKTGLIQIPKDRPADNQIISDVTYSFTESGNVLAKTTNTYSGRSEIVFRPMFSDSTFRRDPAALVRLMLAFFGVQGDGKVKNVSNPHFVGEPFKVEFEAGIENYTTFMPKGRLELPVGLNMVNLAGMEQFTSTESRKTSLMVGATRVAEDINVEVPTAVKITAPPSAFSFSNSVGSYKLTPELKDGRLRIAREFVVFKDLVTTADYPAFKELVRKLRDANTITVDYTANPSLMKAKSKELRTAKPKPPQSLYDAFMGIAGLDESEITSAEAKKLEKKLSLNLKDVETRKKLIRYYSLSDHTAQNEKAHLAHRLWLIRNHPEMGDDDVYGFFPRFHTDAMKGPLKTAWLAEVAKAKENSVVRLNAIEAIKSSFPDVAETLTSEGRSMYPENYKYWTTEVELRGRRLMDLPDDKTVAPAAALLEIGKIALALIKKERSEERDSDRHELLAGLCWIAIKANDLDAAGLYARELVLDFGHSAQDPNYDEAAHVGNTTLGLVELRRNNIEKAKELLLASIRAPLRKEGNRIPVIQTRLAKELFDKGEKAVVAEYLKLCLQLGNLKSYPETYGDEIAALKLWIDQIEKNLSPSFDFQKP